MSDAAMDTTSWNSSVNASGFGSSGSSGPSFQSGQSSQSGYSGSSSASSSASSGGYTSSPSFRAEQPGATPGAFSSGSTSGSTPNTSGSTSGNAMPATPADIDAWSAADRQAFDGHMQELGLSAEQSERLLYLAQSQQSAQRAAHQQEVTRWADAVRADPELGGRQLETTVMQAKAGLQRFDTDGKVFAMLETTGYANHPAVIRMLARIGRELGEDGLVTGRTGGGAAALEDRLFKNMKL